MAIEKLSHLTKNCRRGRTTTLVEYQAAGGYEMLKQAVGSMTPDELIEVVKASGLRGRGGAGFPTGMKWSFMPKDGKKENMLVCNADESEPGTCKDRVLMEQDPHLLVEGVAMAAYAIRAATAWIYVRGEYLNSVRCLERAVGEAEAAGLIGEGMFGTAYKLKVHIMRGAGAYIVGEETAMLESIEGKRGMPRNKPPFPANYGVYGNPTTVNNVETLACVPLILRHGADWFKALGPEKSPGMKLFAFSGHVERPQVVELKLGLPFKDVLDEICGGVWKGRKLKAVIPGGSSSKILTAEKALTVNLDFESCAAAGSMLGTASVIVMDETQCIVQALHNVSRFYGHESCGQCTPCREGVGWMHKVITRIESGTGRQEDLDLLLDLSANIQGNTICAFGDAAAWPVESYIKTFRDEFEAHIKEQKCPFGNHPPAGHAHH